MPPPKADELSAGERYEKEQAKLDLSIKYAPHISAIHHEDPDSPTECQFAMSQSFFHPGASRPQWEAAPPAIAC